LFFIFFFRFGGREHGAMKKYFQKTLDKKAFMMFLSPQNKRRRRFPLP